MKLLTVSKLLVAIILLTVPAFAQTPLSIAIDAPQNIGEGDTFTLGATIRNIGGDIFGKDLSPGIATLVSSDNCIINSAKILGKIYPGESRYVSWVVTAPVKGTCRFSVSAGTLSETYAQESLEVSIGMLEAGSPNQQIGQAPAGNTEENTSNSSEPTPSSESVGSEGTKQTEFVNISNEGGAEKEAEQEGSKYGYDETKQSVLEAIAAFILLAFPFSILFYFRRRIFHSEHKGRSSRRRHQ